jgi:soluble lytic murein transglycosylase-like protein
VVRILLLLLCALNLLSADGEMKVAASVAKMQAAMEKQRASVRRQSGGGDPGSFFTTPWLHAPVPTTTAASSGADGGCEPLPPQELRKLVADAATSEGLNPLLLQAMVARESGGRPCAVSHKGAQGLMQIMPATQAELGLSDPFDASASISAGARYMKQLLIRYDGNLRLALAAYNAGPQRVDVEKDVPAIAETQAYVAAILDTVKPADE